MNVALRRPMTLDEFLVWEDRQELRYEFDGFQPVAMVGGTAAHSSIQVNLITTLATALRGKPCRAHGSHLKIQVAGHIRYPDAFIVCSPVFPDAKVVTGPVVIFEILSPSTSHTDLVIKNDEYHATPSVLHYVVLEQSHAGGMMFSRKGDHWDAKTFRRHDTLELPELGVSLRIEDIYEGLDLLPDEVVEEP